MFLSTEVCTYPYYFLSRPSSSSILERPGALGHTKAPSGRRHDFKSWVNGVERAAVWQSCRKTSKVQWSAL